MSDERSVYETCSRCGSEFRATGAFSSSTADNWRREHRCEPVTSEVNAYAKKAVDEVRLEALRMIEWVRREVDKSLNQKDWRTGK